MDMREFIPAIAERMEVAQNAKNYEEWIRLAETLIRVLQDTIAALKADNGRKDKS